MNFISRALTASILAIALALCLPAPVSAQATMTSTTLSAAITNTQQVFAVASATGISTTAPGTRLYTDKEEMLVTAVSGTSVTVQRGVDGTGAAAHASGSTVYVGPPSYFHSGPDPSGTCTASEQLVLPRVVVATGRVYQCTGGSWVITSAPGSYSLTDGYYFVPPNSCGSKVTTTAYATGYPIVTVAATNEPVYQVTTSTTAGTVQISCVVSVPARIASGKGVTINDISLLYGVQTTAVSSIATATVSTVTFPASSTSGVAAAGTVAAGGGSITATPTVLQLATTTGGLCYNEKLSLGTPISVTTDLQSITVDQIFTTAGTTATTLQVCGLVVHYTASPL